MNIGFSGLNLCKSLNLKSKEQKNNLPITSFKAAKDEITIQSPEAQVARKLSQITEEDPQVVLAVTGKLVEASKKMGLNITDIQKISDEEKMQLAGNFIKSLGIEEEKNELSFNGKSDNSDQKGLSQFQKIKMATVAAFAIAYLIMPADLAPDIIPVIGQIDDAATGVGATAVLVLELTQAYSKKKTGKRSEELDVLQSYIVKGMAEEQKHRTKLK